MISGDLPDDNNIGLERIQELFGVSAISKIAQFRNEFSYFTTTWNNKPLLQAIAAIDTNSRYYSISSHDNDPYDDGYFECWDSSKERKIFVCRKDVGRSQAFIEEKSIAFFVDLVGTDDDHWTNISPRQRKKWYGYMVSTVLQIHNSDGNVSIFCDRGRSRSPSFLAGYLVMVCGYSALQAYSYLSELYLSRRRREVIGIDRDYRFFIFVKWIEFNVMDTNDAPTLTLSEIENLEMRKYRA